MKAAEDIAAKGTALLKELTKLLVRKDPLSAAWLEDRSQLRAKIEAHLELARRGDGRGTSGSSGNDRRKDSIVRRSPAKHPMSDRL
jgi:hypothetical protein